MRIIQNPGEVGGILIPQATVLRAFTVILQPFLAQTIPNQRSRRVTLSLFTGAFGGGVGVTFCPAAWCSQQKSDSNGRHDVDAALTQHTFSISCTIHWRTRIVNIYTYTLSKSDHMFDFEYLAWKKTDSDLIVTLSKLLKDQRSRFTQVERVDTVDGSEIPLT